MERILMLAGMLKERALILGDSEGESPNSKRELVEN